MAKPLSVTVISDTHYYSKTTGTKGKAYDKANAKSQKLLANARELLEAAFRQIAEDTRTDIVLLSGDTTNNGEKAAHAEFIEMLRGLKAKGKRVYVITATHDYQEDGVSDGYDGDGKTEVPACLREELFDLYREFGPDEAISVHRESMSYVVQLADGYRLFAINDDRNGNGKSGISEDCYAWLKAQAEDARKNGQFILSMTHHPLIAPCPIYELIGKNDMMGDYKERRNQFADLGLQFMLTGHTHMQDISVHKSPRGNTMYDIATASTVGFPAVIRTVTINPEENAVSVSTDWVREPVSFDLGGKSLREYLGYQLIGVIQDMIKAAGEDIDTLADMVTAISIKKKLIYKIGWLIKYPARLLNRLKVGTVAKWTRAETGLSPADYASCKDKLVVDFICDMVMNLFGGEDLYTPDAPEYKIAVGLFSIIDSVLETLHIRFCKLVKVSDSVTEFLEPLLHKGSIPSYNAELPIQPYFADGEQDGEAPAEAKAEIRTVKKSKKGPAIVIIAVLLLILLLPLVIAVGIPVLLVGFIVNQARYGKYMKAEA